MNNNYFILIFAALIISCHLIEKMPESPKAKKQEKKLTTHNDTRIDNYYWLNERDNPEVIAYLKQENDYYEKLTASSKKLQKKLFEEMKGRIKEDDNSVPYFYNGYWYIIRYEEGKQYPIYTRKKEKLEAKEEILFDCNEMAKGHKFFQLTGLNISPDNTKAAFGIDTVARRQYVLQIKDLTTGKLSPTKIKNTTGQSVWAKDNKHLFYTKISPETLRWESIYRHNILHPHQKDALIYEEEDETFSVYLSGSKSEEYIFINSHSTLTTETRFISSSKPFENFKIVQPRISGLEYSVAHYKDHFYILTNENKATNFKLVQTPVEKTSLENWKTILKHRKNTLLEDLDIFKDFIAITERSEGLTKVRIFSHDLKMDYYLPIEGETYTLYTTTNIDFNTPKIRYQYSSLTHPSAAFEFNTKTKETELLKEQEVLGGKFKKENYISYRKWALADDGEKIPISIVHHKNTKPSPNTPLLLYAYGSYGATIDPYFSSVRLSLLDRGFIFAIAHIRGGEYMGRSWYEDGKMLYKKNTFTDFISCSKYLIENKLTSADHLYAIGGSAGGLLMGVILNEAPHLYKGIIAAVPFVDVVTTMLDESIPLTTSEYDEWGNPNIKKYYDYMKSYSPYDNVKKQNYPNLFVTAGLHDSQVQYWESAKWVAKLRVNKTDNNKLFLKTNLDAGHGGASGRFNAIKEIAEEYAFIFGFEKIKN